MIQTFSRTPAAKILAIPTAAGGFYARSTEAADTSNLILTGPVSAVQTSETLALTGKRERRFTGNFSTLTHGVLSAAQTGSVGVYAAGTAGTAPLYATANPADGDTVTFGLTGFTQAYRFKDTTAAAYDVKREATATDTIANLKAAINADGVGDGTDYHAGTAANPYLSATVSGVLITLTDRIACSRQLAWSFAQSAASLSLPSTVSGGLDGTLLASILAGGTLAANQILLDDEDLDQDLLPALLDFYSDGIILDGRGATIYVAAENVSTSMAASYEISTDGTHWTAGAAAISNLDANAQIVNVTERARYLRLRITNTNAAPASVNAKIVAA